MNSRPQNTTFKANKWILNIRKSISYEVHNATEIENAKLYMPYRHKTGFKMCVSLL
jgi:hypothetical protein